MCVTDRWRTSGDLLWRNHRINCTFRRPCSDRPLINYVLSPKHSICIFRRTNLNNTDVSRPRWILWSNNLKLHTCVMLSYGTVAEDERTALEVRGNHLGFYSSLLSFSSTLRFHTFSISCSFCPFLATPHPFP